MTEQSEQGVFALARLRINSVRAATLCHVRHWPIGFAVALSKYLPLLAVLGINRTNWQCKLIQIKFSSSELKLTSLNYTKRDARVSSVIKERMNTFCFERMLLVGRLRQVRKPLSHR